MLHEDCHACKEDCSKCHYRLNSSLEGITAPDKEKIQGIISSLITELLKNTSTTLPIFMTALLSGVSSAFSSKSLSTPLVLWITGEPGSGKTQLASYLGSFYNKPQQRNDSMIANNYLRANVSTKLLQERIRKSRDNIVLLDDVKADASTSLKEHTNTNIDILIRSIYDHNLSGFPVYGNAIITGEYRPTGDSTLDRLILMPLKSYQDAPKNLETLSFFQNNGFLLTDFMILFLQWTCGKLENAGFLSLLQSERTRYTERYISKGFSPRKSEILSTLRLGLYLLEKFCCKYTPPSFNGEIGSLVANGEVCFKKLVKSTAYLHENSLKLYAEIFSSLVLYDKNVRCVPEIKYEGEVDLFNFCFSPDEDGIFIENPSAIAEKDYFKDTSHCKPCLLIRKEILEEDLKFKAEDYCTAHNIPIQNTGKNITNWLTNIGFILVDIQRSDKDVNRIMKYPVIDINVKYGQPACFLGNFYSINLDLPSLDKLKFKLCSKKKERLPVVPLTTSREKELQDLGYRNAEHRNHSNYQIIYNKYHLNEVKKDFQSLFDYRFTKN